MPPAFDHCDKLIGACDKVVRCLRQADWWPVVPSGSVLASALLNNVPSTVRDAGQVEGAQQGQRGSLSPPRVCLPRGYSGFAATFTNAQGTCKHSQKKQGGVHVEVEEGAVRAIRTVWLPIPSPLCLRCSPVGTYQDHAKSTSRWLATSALPMQ
jgi:hypothetical protein